MVQIISFVLKSCIDKWSFLTPFWLNVKKDKVRLDETKLGLRDPLPHSTSTHIQSKDESKGLSRQKIRLALYLEGEIVYINIKLRATHAVVRIWYWLVLQLTLNSYPEQTVSLQYMLRYRIKNLLLISVSHMKPLKIVVCGLDHGTSSRLNM